MKEISIGDYFKIKLRNCISDSFPVKVTNGAGRPNCSLYIGDVEVVSKPDRPGVISCQGLIGLRVSSAETADI